MNRSKLFFQKNAGKECYQSRFALTPKALEIIFQGNQLKDSSAETLLGRKRCDHLRLVSVCRMRQQGVFGYGFKIVHV